MTKKGDKDKKIKELEDRIRELERLNKENKPEQKENKQPESIVGSIAGGLIPGLGSLINMMQKMPEFEDKLKEADNEIGFRIGKGGMPKPRIAFDYSIRPLASGGVPRTSKEEEPKTIVVWEETPPVEKEDLKIYPIGKKLIIETKDKKYKKEIPLAYYVKDILEVNYQKGKDRGLLIVRMKRR